MITTTSSSTHRRLAAALIGLGILASTTPVVAQPRGARPAPERSAAEPGPYDRGYQLYSRQTGSSGIIRWNTPNRDGNLGGPNTGGGGGGGK